MFLIKATPIYTITGRIQHFLDVWKIIKEDQRALSLVRGYKIPLLNVPLQIATPKKITVSQGPKNTDRHGSERNLGNGFNL